jgi:hypothetical protein
MTSSDIRVPKLLRSRIVVAALSAAAAILATLGLLSVTGWLNLAAPSRQAQIHESGAQVMPFDLNKTTHIFTMTQTGGVQQVIAKHAGDAAQIALIRQHLQQEATQFRAGDFSDPAGLHGEAMPGLSELKAGATRIRVEYVALPNGAQLTYTSNDPQLITALHQWFGAQLSDHAHDATDH